VALHGLQARVPHAYRKPNANVQVRKRTCGQYQEAYKMMTFAIVVIAVGAIGVAIYLAMRILLTRDARAWRK